MGELETAPYKTGNAVYPMLTKVRELEAWLREVGGFQHTYCDSFQTEEEFEEMFDHSLYNEMRIKYGAEDVFPRVYGKTRPEVDVWQWVAEEEELIDKGKSKRKRQ